MQRLVIALTTLLALTGAVVVAGYLFVFAAQPDRLARAVPEGSAAYATFYLQPSAGQKMNLAAVLGRVPGFEDAASLDLKIHDITARLLGGIGFDYEADIRPWLGNQVSFAAQPEGLSPDAANMLLVVAVKDRDAAAAALDRLAVDVGEDGTAETYQGVEMRVGAEMSWALLDDVLLVGSSADVVRGGLDADAGRTASLADSSRHRQAMEELPADHLAAVYVDLEALASAAGGADQFGGYDTAALALVVEAEGIRLSGSAPFDADAASAPAREAFALASEPSSLAEWMPTETQAEVVMFGLSQTLRAAETALDGEGTDAIADALNQLRALAALGLGINLDDDLLPLFDREAAIAVSGLEGATPRGQLLLRPTDSEAAAAALDRMRDALEERGARVEEEDVHGVAVTSLAVPELGTVAYAVLDGVIVAGLGVDDVAAVLAARESGETLASTERYREAWALAGTRGGNELWFDAASVVDAADEALGVSGEARDILLEIGAVAVTAPSRDDHTEVHAVLTVR